MVTPEYGATMGGRNRAKWVQWIRVTHDGAIEEGGSPGPTVGTGTAFAEVHPAGGVRATAEAGRRGHGGRRVRWCVGWRGREWSRVTSAAFFPAASWGVRQLLQEMQ